MKAPAFQFYAGDFLVGTAMMSAEEVGGYVRLLCYQWTQGSIPNDDAILQRLTGCGGNAVASIRHKFGISQTGALVNERLEQVREEQRLYRAKQAENARKGWETRKNHRVGVAKPDAVALPTNMPNGCSSVFSLQSSKNTLPSQAPAEAVAKEIAQKGERPRNELLDTLATIGGGSTKDVTETNWKLAAKALKSIKAVAPDLTADEIKRRAKNLQSYYKDLAITANFLEKNWAMAATPKRHSSFDEIKIDRS